jgi:hypothetical protein
MESAILRYTGLREPAPWEDLDAWVDQKHPTLNTDEERKLLSRINPNFDAYRDATWPVHTNNQPPAVTAQVQWAGLEGFSAESHRLLDLGGQLAATHRAGKEALLALRRSSGGGRSLTPHAPHVGNAPGLAGLDRV